LSAPDARWMCRASCSIQALSTLTCQRLSRRYGHGLACRTTWLHSENTFAVYISRMQSSSSSRCCFVAKVCISFVNSQHGSCNCCPVYRMWFQRSYLQKSELSSNYWKSLMAQQLNQMASSLLGTSRKYRGDLWKCVSWTGQIAVSLLIVQPIDKILHFRCLNKHRVCLVVYFIVNCKCLSCFVQILWATICLVSWNLVLWTTCTYLAYCVNSNVAKDFMQLTAYQSQLCSIAASFTVDWSFTSIHVMPHDLHNLATSNLNRICQYQQQQSM